MAAGVVTRELATFVATGIPEHGGLPQGVLVGTLVGLLDGVLVGTSVGVLDGGFGMMGDDV
jgi:hypothetical protein